MRSPIPRLLTTILALCALNVWAGRDEPPLTAQDKERLIQLANQALDEQDISPQQHQATLHWIHATPCKGVDRSLSAQRKTRLEAALARERGFTKVEVFDTFRQGRWWIVYSTASSGDTPYHFYAGDPISGTHPINVWSGAATIFETSEVAQLTQDHAPGIPPSLANCFAWHVTLSPR